MNLLSPLLKERRKLLGLSQVALAGISGISLPTIQNIETGKGNPSIQVLIPLLKALGLNLAIQPSEFDWNQLADLGAPILTQNEPNRSLKRAARTASNLIESLTAAALDLHDHGKNANYKDADRKLESMQALTLALKSHYPSLFKTHCTHAPLLLSLVPDQINGRLLKLKRQALSRISEYL